MADNELVMNLINLINLGCVKDWYKSENKSRKPLRIYLI
jgi:hypothetical protein